MDLQRTRRERIAYFQLAFVGAIADDRSLGLASGIRSFHSNASGKDGASVENRIQVHSIPLLQARGGAVDAVAIKVGARIECNLHLAAAEDLHRNLIAHAVQLLHGAANKTGLGGRQRGQIGQQTGGIESDIRNIVCGRNPYRSGNHRLRWRCLRCGHGSQKRSRKNGG